VTYDPYHDGMFDNPVQVALNKSNDAFGQRLSKIDSMQSQLERLLIDAKRDRNDMLQDRVTLRNSVYGIGDEYSESLEKADEDLREARSREAQKTHWIRHRDASAALSVVSMIGTSVSIFLLPVLTALFMFGIPTAFLFYSMFADKMRIRYSNHDDVKKLEFIYNRKLQKELEK